MAARPEMTSKTAGWVVVDRTHQEAVETACFSPTLPVLTARTATGTELTSDGRTLLVYVGPAQTTPQ